MEGGQFTTVTDASTVGMANVTLKPLSGDERMVYLDSLDAKMWPYIYPVIIYLLLLMVIGVVGNSIVLLVYARRFKPSTTRLFILTLGIFDLLISSLSVPGVVVEMRYHYTFFFPAVCRIFRATRMYFVLVSMFTLVIVAVDRYRKVCRPLKPQYTIRSAGYSILATNIVAIIFTILGTVVGGKRTVPTPRPDVTGSNCTYDDKFIGKPITKFYSIVWFLTFFLCVGILIVLYTLIGIKVWQHRRFRFYQTKPKTPPSSNSDSQNATSSTDTQAEVHQREAIEADESSDLSTGADDNVQVVSYNPNTDSTTVSTEKLDDNHVSKQKRPKSKAKSKDGPKTRKNKMTFIFVNITAVFIMSFLPFLIMVALWSTKSILVKDMQGYTFTVFKIFFHSYHVNSVVNCYIYGFCNPKFRKECKEMLCYRFAKK